MSNLKYFTESAVYLGKDTLVQLETFHLEKVILTRSQLLALERCDLRFIIFFKELSECLRKVIPSCVKVKTEGGWGLDTILPRLQMFCQTYKMKRPIYRMQHGLQVSLCGSSKKYRS